jgi:hypothetical protein
MRVLLYVGGHETWTHPNSTSEDSINELPTDRKQAS